LPRRNKRKGKRAEVLELPTAQFAQHGRYVHQRVDRGGPKVAGNVSIVPLVDCFERGQITWGMYNAGLQFERLANQFRVLIEAPCGSRDFSVRGNINETSVERSLRIKDEFIAAVNAVEPCELAVLRAILIEHEKTGDRRGKYRRWSYFKDGLKGLQKHWKIAENEKM
jgi:hypothetical protein